MARRPFKHITFPIRLRIEMRVNAGYKPQEIADELGFDVSTIYRELGRGQYEHLNSDYTTEWRYSPEIAETRARENLAAKGAPLKIGNNYAVAEFIQTMLLEENYSPEAICALLRKEEVFEKYHITFCRATLYKYIDDGNIFPDVTNADLPERGERGKKKSGRPREKRAPRGRSIEERPKEIDDRSEFGHWEMDTVLGKKKTKARLLVLTERKTRREIIIRIPDGTAASVVRALDRLERIYGSSFSRVFKTITVDNGSEFADCEGLERSCRRKGKRTTVYYCHPYSSYERGSNENLNKMIRRLFPKGTSFDSVTARDVRRVEEWLNNYPRKILGYESAISRFSRELSRAA